MVSSNNKINLAEHCRAFYSNSNLYSQVTILILPAVPLSQPPKRVVASLIKKTVHVTMTLSAARSNKFLLEEKLNR